MKDTLGILVASEQHLAYVIHITRAAFEKGKEVKIFFTGKGVRLTLAPEFKNLTGMARIFICDASFRAHGLHGREQDVYGVRPMDFTHQTKNAELFNLVDRYLVL